MARSATTATTKPRQRDRSRAEKHANQRNDLDNAVDAFSIEAFCRRHFISIQLFYKMKSEMPPTFKIGKRVLISKEAADAWRRKREAASAAEVL